MGSTQRFFVAILVGFCCGSSDIQAATRAEKKCAAYKAERAIKTETSKSTDVNVDVSKLGIGLEGGVERSSSEEAELQALPEDVIRRSEQAYQHCIDWQNGAITKAEFKAFRQQALGIETDAEREAEKNAQKNARKAIREQGKQDRAKIRAKARAKARTWVALSSAAVTIGGGYIVYSTTETARETQLMNEGPKDEWENLQQLNTIGWYAAAGGLLMLKVTLSAGSAPGFAIHGAF